ncbi:MAG TPA: helix-turn-helix domain-containing protein [Streptosporangiaceae bacterium]|nr:helix-turn-helix domain-containing protein [Streptosporangiaceae bacterium]
MEKPRPVTHLSDPRALRAYAHPVRMALVGLLRTEGPLTATKAAELLGESSGTCSFHLRQLAKYGLVEEAGGGTGREKPWQATTMTTSWSSVTRDPEMAAATSMLNTIVAERYFEQLATWLERGQTESQQWQEAALFGDFFLYVTAEELTEIGRRVQGLLEDYRERQTQPELRPDGARRVTFLKLAFPTEYA